MPEPMRTTKPRHPGTTTTAEATQVVAASKRLVYLFCVLMGAVTTAFSILSWAMDSSQYSPQTALANLPFFVILLAMAWCLAKKWFMTIIERILIAFVLTYVFLWDIAFLIHQMYPENIISNRNPVLAIGCVLIAVSFARRTALIAIAVALAAHMALFWINLARFPWGTVHTHQLNDSFLFLILTATIMLFTAYGSALGVSNRLTEDLSVQAHTDELTGLPNRRYMAHFLLEHPSCAVALIDIDNFKSINDTQGHEKGDQALQMVSYILHEACKHAGVVGRWGGEEFLAVFPHLPHQDVPEVLETAQTRLRKEPPPHTVTYSAGVSNRVPGQSVDSVLRAVDFLLYEAKRRGKDRILCAGAGARGLEQAHNSPANSVKQVTGLD